MTDPNLQNLDKRSQEQILVENSDIPEIKSSLSNLTQIKVDFGITT